MSKPNDGGLAFPQPMSSLQTGEMYCAVEKHPDFGGMTLRDWFSGQILAGMYANPSASGDHKQFADAACKAADAMIERMKR